MAEITAKAVQALRDRTDLPMMECKKALVEAEGDQEKAIEILKRNAKKVIDKGKDRITSEGRVATLVADDGSAAAMIELRCESAPVTKSEDFTFLCDQLLKRLLAGPAINGPDELMAQKCPDRPQMTLTELHEEVVNKIRENIVLARCIRVDGPVGGYSHHNGSLGVLFQVTGKSTKPDVIRDVAMHIAALNPTVCLPSELDADKVAAEKAKLTEEAKKSGKPENIIEKMVTGKLRTYFRDEGVLVEQAFAKDDTKSVSQALAEAGLTAVRFIRWRLGQS